MNKPQQMRATAAEEDMRPATAKTPVVDRLNGKPGQYTNVAIDNKRKLEAISRKILAGKVDQDLILCDLAECIHDMNCVAEYCEQAEAEINFMCTPGWRGKEQ